MYCKTCGNELNDLAVVCPKCGCAVKEEKQRKETDLSKINSILSYVALAILCLAIVFMVCSIISGWVDVNTYYHQNYDGRIAHIESYGLWSTNISLLGMSFIFSILGFLTSVANFVLAFKKENKNKLFRSTAIFMLGVVMLYLSIYGITY